MDIYSAKRKLWNLMGENYFLPDEDDYYRIRNLITIRGKKMLDYIIGILGQDNYDKICFDYENNFCRDDLVRVLGFGNCLTEYMVYPLELDNKKKELTVRLGALANLIVTIFDTFIDNGKLPVHVLSEDILFKLSKSGIKNDLNPAGQYSSHVITDFNLKSNEAVIISKLVKEYFNTVDEIIISGGDEKKRDMLLELIISMYRSEINTLNIKSFNDFNNKSVLPFVVMGFGGMLWKSKSDIKEFNEFLNWLYEFGSLFGILDDLIDFEDDIKNNMVNLFIHNEERNKGIAVEDIDNIIKKAGFIKKYWIEKVPYRFGIPDEIKYSLIICMVSWLGGYINNDNCVNV